MIIFKPTVRIGKLTPAIKWILDCLYEIDSAGHEYVPKEIWITSANDSVHSYNPLSRHFTDEAVDVRSLNFRNRDCKMKFVRMLSSLLNSHIDDPNKFTVLFEEDKPHTEYVETEHFHVQVRKGMRFEKATIS
jgi:hypothetical protein